MSFLSYQASQTESGRTNTVVVAEGAAVLTGDHGLHITGHRVYTVLDHAGRLGKEGDSVGLEHDVVPLVRFRLQSNVLCGRSDTDWGTGYYRLSASLITVLSPLLHHLLGLHLLLVSGRGVHTGRPDGE